MQQSLLPLLFLAIVTVCSTNELPFLNRLELEKIFEEQDNDNILNDRLENRDIEKIMFKQQLNRHPLLKPKISNLIYEKEENGDENIHNDVKEYIYDEFNKNQRHTDCLNARLHIKSKTNENSCRHNFKQYFKKDIESYSNNMNINQFEDSLNNYEDVTISPLLILKIRLSYLSNNIKNMHPKLYRYTGLVPLQLMLENRNDNVEYKKNDVNSALSKMKREENGDYKSTELNADKSKMVVKKRIFSLWSRLQGLTHRGHELHHRRHLHAFYGLPDDGGGGGDGETLTAETRATFMRPPGSPLRWG